MEFKEIQKILEQYHFFGFTVHRDDKYNLKYTFRSIRYFTVQITVHIIKVNPDKLGGQKLVNEIRIGQIKIDDAKELITTLNNLNSIHKNILFKNKKR